MIAPLSKPPAPVRRERPAGARRQPEDPYRHDAALIIGRQVRATAEMSSVMLGDPGVVIGRYIIESRPGYIIIFKSGFLDGFSPDEVDMLLEITDLVHPHLDRYDYRSAAQVSTDFAAGKIWPR